MAARSQDQRAAGLAMALLRATLVGLIFISEHLVDERRLDSTGFWVVLSVAIGYSFIGIVVAIRFPDFRAFVRVAPILDVLLLAGLTYTSGGAFSDVRKAFFVIPLAAAFSERPLSTGTWSLIAVVAFTIEAALAGGHLAGSPNSWQRVTLSQDLYLVWTGVAATVLAIALARRTSETRSLAASRQRLVTHAIESVERERTRLAGALHDEPVQNLIAARHDLRRAERTGDPDSFARLHEALDDTLSELREEIFKLHPHVLDHVGLAAAIEQVARRHAREGELYVNVDIEADTEPSHRQVLFSLGRELLANAAKHANASEVRASVTSAADSVTLEVVDNGTGIPEGRLQQALLDGHIGLAEIGERVAALNGRLTISSAPGAGTRVRVTLPNRALDAPGHRHDSTPRLAHAV